MAREPEELTHRLLRDIRAKQDEHSALLADHTGRLGRLDKRIEDMTRVLRYSMGQNEETAFRQSEQAMRIDDLFEKLEKLLSSKQPV